MGISVVLRKIENGSQNHYKDTTKEVECESKQEVFDDLDLSRRQMEIRDEVPQITSHGTAIKEQVNSKRLGMLHKKR